MGRRTNVKRIDEWTEKANKPTKEDRTECNDWRAITLPWGASKVMIKAILERMKGEINKLLKANPAGFISNRSCKIYPNS